MGYLTDDPEHRCEELLEEAAVLPRQLAQDAAADSELEITPATPPPFEENPSPPPAN